MKDIKKLSTKKLIERMESASQDTNLDDETVELNKRGIEWTWNDSFTNPKIIIK